jgi:hypothetical protein
LLVLPRKAPCAVWTWSILLRRSWWVSSGLTNMFDSFEWS